MTQKIYRSKYNISAEMPIGNAKYKVILFYYNKTKNKFERIIGFVWDEINNQLYTKGNFFRISLYSSLVETFTGNFESFIIFFHGGGLKIYRSLETNRLYSYSDSFTGIEIVSHGRKLLIEKIK